MSNLSPVNPATRPWGVGTVSWTRDAIANDSEKSFVCPANKLWKVDYIGVCLTATATVGNRYLALGLFDTDNTLLWASPPIGPIAASQVGQVFASTSLPVATTVRRALSTAALNVSANVQADTSLPPIVLTAGQYIKALDTAAIDAAADDMIVVIHYESYDV